MSRPTTAVTLTAGNPLGASTSGGEREAPTSQTSNRDPQNAPLAQSDSSLRSRATGKAPMVPNNNDRRSGESITSDGRRELFAQEPPTAMVVKRFAPRGRAARRGAAFTRDFQVGKIGVLSLQECDLLEDRMLASLATEELALADRSLEVKSQFLTALNMYLAINGGSVGNSTGRLGVKDDSEPLRFADVEVSAVEVASMLGDKAYAYMRARATEIRDTLESMFATVETVNAEILFPGVCYAAGLVKVVAAKRGLSQYPQYAAIGSEYAANVPPYLMAIIMQSSAATLDGTSSNVRASRVPTASQSPPSDGRD